MTKPLLHSVTILVLTLATSAAVQGAEVGLEARGVTAELGKTTSHNDGQRVLIALC
jgi:hypothetical protein